MCRSRYSSNNKHREDLKKPGGNFFCTCAKTCPVYDNDTIDNNVKEKHGQKFGQKEPPRLGSTICYGQTWARKSHQDSAVRFVTAKSWPERATKTRQYDLLRPNVGQKEPPKLGSTICDGQELARKSHQDSAVRFVTAKSGPERTETRPGLHHRTPSPFCRAYPQPTLEPRPCPRRPCEGRKFVGKVENSWARPGKFVGKAAENSWARRKIRGQGGKFVGKAENSWARRKIRGQDGIYSWARPKIRGQGGKIRGQGGKFVGKAGVGKAIFRLAHEFSALPTNFPALPTNFPPCPRIFPPCPRISPPCPRISLGFKLVFEGEGLGLWWMTRLSM